MTTTEANKQIVDAFITGLFTDGDLGAVDRYLDPGFVNHDPPMPGAFRAGPDGHAAGRRDVPARLSRIGAARSGT